MNFLRIKIHKILHWEYWPMSILYFPVLPVWIYFAIRAKSFFFFNAANPTIKNGGMAMESKKEIYDLIPSEYIPKTIYFNHGTSVTAILSKAKKHEIELPFIIKPDIGMKGLGVQIIKNEIDLTHYLKKSFDNILVQELINYPKEIGVFYCRMPGKNFGEITGIVSKDFLSVKGNGKSSILQLIKYNYRSYIQLSTLKKTYGKALNTILQNGETFVLVPYGSHTRGSKFTDITNLSTPELEHLIDQICQKIDGFYYGRLDIMYSTIEKLSKGLEFTIIELNGAGSEPTHIYDPCHSVLFAWKEIIKHWRLLYSVSSVNFSNGHPYLNFNEGREMLKANSILERKLKSLYL